MAQPLNGLALLQQYQAQDQARQLGDQQLQMAPVRQQMLMEEMALKRQAAERAQQQMGMLQRLQEGNMARQNMQQQATQRFQEGRLAQMAAAAGKPQPLTDIGKLNADLQGGKITKDQFESASRSKLGDNAVIPPEHSSLTGDEYLKTLPQGMQNTVKAVVEGKVPLTSFSIRNNQRDAVIQRATQYDPTFEAGKAPARMAVQKDFTSGVAARNVTAINTAIRHMGTLHDLGTALDNGDIKVLNTVLNRVATETGDPRVNNFDTAKSAVGNELMRVFRQVNASEQETKDWESKFASASSPAQLKGAIKVGVELLDGRIKAMDEQWMRGMDTDKGYPNLLTPTAKDILGKIGGNPKRRAADGKPGLPDASAIDAELARRRAASGG